MHCAHMLMHDFCMKRCQVQQKLNNHIVAFVLLIFYSLPRVLDDCFSLEREL